MESADGPSHSSCPISPLLPKADVLSDLQLAPTEATSLSTCVDALAKEIEKLAPCVHAGLGVQSWRAALDVQSALETLDWETYNPHRPRSVGQQDAMTRALIFQMLKRMRVTMRLQPPHSDVGERC